MDKIGILVAIALISLLVNIALIILFAATRASLNDCQRSNDIWRHEANDYLNRIKKLTSVIRMDGAPEAPCEDCPCKKSNILACRCLCHARRIDYISKSFENALML